MESVDVAVVGRLNRVWGPSGSFAVVSVERYLKGNGLASVAIDSGPHDTCRSGFEREARVRRAFLLHQGYLALEEGACGPSIEARTWDQYIEAIEAVAGPGIAPIQTSFPAEVAAVAGVLLKAFLPLVALLVPIWFLRASLSDRILKGHDRLVDPHQTRRSTPDMKARWLLRVVVILVLAAIAIAAIAYALKSNVPEPLILAAFTFIVLIVGLWLTRDREIISIDTSKF